MNGVWEQFLKVAHEELGSRVVETWFKAISLDTWDLLQKKIFLQVPNKFVRDWIEKNYRLFLQAQLGRLLNIEKPELFLIDLSTQKSHELLPLPIKKVVDEAPRPTQLVKQKKGSLAKTMVRKQTMVMNSNYLFKTFVVGPNNSLAYAAAMAVAEKPGKLYNPLFIYGESGLGKTHLLHAIGNDMQERSSNATILYQTADRFVNEFIHAIRFDAIDKFQRKYQDIDVLLIDDVQFISNKEQTQEAFFHIFNSLYESHKQIVFSSDTFPQDIKGIAERLRSRLGWGLVTDLHMPSLETRIAILKKKAAMSNHCLDDDVACFLASHAVTNIRELEGAMVRVIAFASLTNQPITLDLAERVLLQKGVKQESPAVDHHKILQEVSKSFHYTVHDLQSKNRNKDLIIARHIATFLMKQLTDKSLREIGDALGGRDHSTIVHGLQKIEKLLRDDAALCQQLKLIQQKIVAS